MNEFLNLLSAFVREGAFASEFDPNFYRQLHPDLTHFDEAGLVEHYEKYGRNEGRMASAAAHRVGFLAQISLARPILEIGPAVRPALQGPNVKYFDLADAAGLVARAEQECLSSEACPSTVHFVSPTGDLRVVEGKFDVLFSSHCIEHQANLIQHFKDAKKKLTNKVMYFMIIPDKRYCFDALLPESSVEELIAAFAEKRKVHTLANVIAHFALTTHNDPVAHWKGSNGELSDQSKADRTDAAIARYNANDGRYIDVHSLQFTPKSFRSIIGALYERKLIKLNVLRVYDTAHNRNEFCAILQK